ncbi:MAG: hypothetical protein QME81_07990 [bacterium]|nr:hypothetical protein [bacterium]
MNEISALVIVSAIVTLQKPGFFKKHGFFSAISGRNDEQGRDFY